MKQTATIRSSTDLQRIPGVGPSIAADLCQLGVREVAELRGRNPEKLYADFCRRQGRHIDRCLLYVFRCAVYFASETKHDPELLKWWNWKDAGGHSKAAARHERETKNEKIETRK
jgi:pathogenicity locus Cdd1 protein